MVFYVCFLSTKCGGDGGGGGGGGVGGGGRENTIRLCYFM